MGRNKTTERIGSFPLAGRDESMALVLVPGNGAKECAQEEQWMGIVVGLIILGRCRI